MSGSETATRTESVIRDRKTLFGLIGSYSMLIAGAVVLMVPFFWLVSSSLKTDQEISDLKQIMPRQPQVGNFIDSLDFMGLELPAWASSRDPITLSIPPELTLADTIRIDELPEGTRLWAPYAVATSGPTDEQGDLPAIEVSEARKRPSGWHYRFQLDEDPEASEIFDSSPDISQFTVRVRNAARKVGGAWEIDLTRPIHAVLAIPPSGVVGDRAAAFTAAGFSETLRVPYKVPADPRPRLIPRFPALANTIVITVLVLLLQVASSAVAGYGFARYRFRGREPVFMVMLATMMLPFQVTMIPVFLLFRQLGWIDSLLPLIVPFACGNPFFIFMFRQFFMQIPQDLVEAAKLDGASAFRTFRQIMLPLTKPVIAICAIYSFMFTWNDFLAPLIYLNSPEMRTLAIELNTFNGQHGVEQRNLLLAASLITMLPCVLLFFSAQKHFVDSGASGGLKG